MREVTRTALLPYPAALAYRVVADVDQYAAFVPGCVLSRVEQADALEMRARLGFRVRGLADTFVTHNRLQPDRRVEMRLLEGPFRHLEGAWQFNALSESGCKVSLQLQMEFGHRMMDLTLGPWLDRAAGSIVDAFARRIRTVAASA